MLRRQGSHFAPMRKGWLLAAALLCAAAGTAVASGLRGGPEGKPLRLLSGTSTTSDRATTTAELDPTSSTTESTGARGSGIVAADGVERARGSAGAASSARPAQPTVPGTIATLFTTTTVDPDAAEEAAEEEERRREEEEEAQRDAEREARRQAD